MSKPLSVERGLELSLVMNVVGIILLFFGLSDVLGWPIDLGGWGFWSGGVGIILLIVGIIWSVSIIQRMRRFRVLMTEKSKAVFVRSLDDLEYMAWRLPSKYDLMVMQKKGDMGVK